MGRSRSLRTGAAVLAFPVVVAASMAVARLLNADDPAVGAVVLLVPAGLYGAAVRRAWTLAMPWVWAGIYLAVFRAAGGCPGCGAELDWSTYPYLIFGVAFVLMLAVAIGAYIAIAAEDLRDAPPGR